MMQDKIQAVYVWLYDHFNRLPDAIQIMIYVTISGILNIESQRILNIQTNSLELTLIFQLVANVLVYAAKQVGQKSVDRIKAGDTLPPASII